MSVPVQDSLPDLADRPASGPLEPERTELANGVRADGHPGWLTGPPTYSGDLLRSAPARTDLRTSGWKRRSNTSRAERRFLRHLHGGLQVRYGFSHISQLT
jgi:hypothetical protein